MNTMSLAQSMTSCPLFSLLEVGGVFCCGQADIFYLPVFLIETLPTSAVMLPGTNLSTSKYALLVRLVRARYLVLN